MHARPRSSVLFLLAFVSCLGAAACGGDDVTPPPPGTEGPTCGNGVVDADEQCERLVGCAEGESCNADCACEVIAASPPTSQQLIADAFARGTIDYPTSLEYRVWALFNAPELPAAYDGAGTSGEDTHLFLELGRVSGLLPAPIATAIAPYLVRPSDPASVYSRPPSFAPTFLPATPDPGCPLDGIGQPDWRPYETTNFVVWSCGGGVGGSDDLATARVTTGKVAEEAWAALVPKMVAPLPDTYNAGPPPQNRIDIYILVPNECRTRNGFCTPIEGKVMAAAAPDRPCAAGPGGTLSSSAYIVVGAKNVPAVAPTADTESEFRYLMAHELFHAITFRQNFEAQGGVCVPAPNLPSDDLRSWLTEASAEWASAAFFPDDAPNRRARLFELFQKERDNDKYGLHSTAIDTHPYEAFMYPFFVQEETNNNPSLMLSFWNGSAGAKTRVDLDNRLNSLFPFSAHFRDFAVRNLNRDLPGYPADAHNAYDPALPFTEAYAAKVLQPTLIFAGPVSDLDSALAIAPLAVQTERYQLLPLVRWFRIDASGVGNASHLALDAIVKVKGVWSRRKIDGPVFEFCREDEKDDIDELYVVYSNSDRARAGRMDGNFRITTKTACPGGWSGTFKVVQTIDEDSTDPQPAGTSVTSRHERDEQEWTVTGTRLVGLPGAPPGYETETVDTAWHGMKSVDLFSSFTDQCGVATSTTIGSGNGTSTTAFAALALGGGNFTLQPTMISANYMFDKTSVSMNCPSGTVTTVGQDMSVEAFTYLTSIPEFATLTEEPGNPGHFKGRATFLHDVQARPNGQQVIDISAEWDLTRKLTPAP